MLALLVRLCKCQYLQVALSRWEWAHRWEMACRGEALVVLLEFLVLSQAAGVAMEGVPCLWAAEATLAEATLIWMLPRISVVY